MSGVILEPWCRLSFFAGILYLFEESILLLHIVYVQQSFTKSQPGFLLMLFKFFSSFYLQLKGVVMLLVASERHIFKSCI